MNLLLAECFLETDANVQVQIECPSPISPKDVAYKQTILDIFYGAEDTGLLTRDTWGLLPEDGYRIFRDIVNNLHSKARSATIDRCRFVTFLLTQSFGFMVEGEFLKHALNSTQFKSNLDTKTVLEKATKSINVALEAAERTERLQYFGDGWDIEPYLDFRNHFSGLAREYPELYDQFTGLSSIYVIAKPESRGELEAYVMNQGDGVDIFSKRLLSRTVQKQKTVRRKSGTSVTERTAFAITNARRPLLATYLYFKRKFVEEGLEDPDGDILFSLMYSLYVSFLRNRDYSAKSSRNGSEYKGFLSIIDGFDEEFEILENSIEGDPEFGEAVGNLKTQIKLELMKAGTGITDKADSEFVHSRILAANDRLDGKRNSSVGRILTFLGFPRSVGDAYRYIEEVGYASLYENADREESEDY